MQRFVSPQLAEACVFPEPLRASRLAGQRILFPCQQALYEASRIQSHCGASPCCSDGRTVLLLDEHHQRWSALGPYAVPFDRPMISLNLPIALRVVGRSFYMGHSCDTYEFFEVSGNELGAVIRDDSRSCIGVLFSASLDNRAGTAV